MEALLRELKAYGLKDLSFVIVNSKDEFSASMIDELQNRVSFPVYQETEDELVWSVLGGGKDDMYVYDRCGRLTYYIPFPHSIIHEKQPIVKAAIFSTYFQSPCGQSCSPNTTFLIDLVEEQNNNIQNNDVIPDETIEAQPVKNTDNVSKESNDDSLVEAYVPDYYEIYGNFSLDDNNTIPEIERGTQGWNKTTNQNATHQEASEENLIISLMSLFGWKGITQSTTVKPITNNSLEALPDEKNTIDVQENKEMHVHHVHLGIENHTMHSTNEKAANDIADRCQEAEENVCRSWSKRRLIQAQECCASLADPKIPRPEAQLCHSYGKKRCKKIKIIIKCCLKTELHKASEETEANIESKEIM